MSIVSDQNEIGIDDADNVSTEESCNNEYTSPGGSRYWIPNVGDTQKLLIGTRFHSLDEGIDMYSNYARSAGFVFRKSTQKKASDGTIRLKMLLCSKEGLKHKGCYDSLDRSCKKKQRRRPAFRIGCPAHVKFHYVNVGFYEVYSFEERHNHPLVSSDDSHLIRTTRKLSFSQQTFIQNCANANIGPVRAHNLLKEFSGGYEYVGVTKVDVKNFKRDINCYIGHSDAQMVVDRFVKKKEDVPNFSFEYSLGDNGQLTGLFLADETMKLNYIAFGDVVSFDATFSTNKYKMVFVPFTGVDNHKKSVTFGAGLLANESIESYKWLLSAFLLSMNREPYYVVTDQDPAMKQAIDSVFTSAKHRLCMWHIMNKLPNKIGAQLCIENGFRARLHNIVWNEDIEAGDFEEQWLSLIKECKLENNKWLSDLFAMRDKWIPAFFRDLPMSGLMRTTSRSESENFFFGQHSNSNSSLLQFFILFESAMDKQRNNQRLLDHNTRDTTPDLKTPLKIEEQARDLYTREIFYDVQSEIYASVFSCSQLGINTEDGLHTHIIQHRAKDDSRKRQFEVVFNGSDRSVICSCKMFERYGIFCRHIFYVLTLNYIEKIPQQYVLNRWTRDAVKDQSCKMISERHHDADNMISDIYSSVRYFFNRIGNDSDKLGVFRDKINQLITEFDDDSPKQSALSKKDVIESLLGASQPAEVIIQVPTGIRNKGCGTSKRLIGSREKALINATKAKRNCKTCGLLSNHDSRNCPKKA